MGLLRRVRGKKSPRVVVVSLDGTPYTLVRRMVDEGRLPHLAALAREGTLRQMDSVWPWVSSVAWATFMTGCNPGKHGIFGFVDRDLQTGRTYIPTARHLQVSTLWERLSQAGKRVAVFNVPVTYPPRPINGLLVGCFLSPKLEKATYPPDLAATLQGLGYRIDADPWLARESKAKMLRDIEDVLERRIRTLFHFLAEERWDFFMMHIMETDRLHHFFWREMETGEPHDLAEGFSRVYARVDAMLGRLRDHLDEATTLLVLSDHGFCGIDQEVYVNRWLADQGWLRLRNVPPDPQKGVLEVDPASRAYSLDPGRVFVNLKGREPTGGVEPTDYDAVREEIAAAALDLRDPERGTPFFRRAFRREELYHGPFLEQAADLILAPYDGYDPKGPLYKETLTFRGDTLVGMHTYDDAFCLAVGQPLAERRFSIVDLAPTILTVLGVPIPPEMDGVSLLR
ncbi:MAG: alkaline phosphatase family protein [Anaerolineae bacterium]